MPQYSPDEAVDLLADAGLLTERQAEAFVLRRVEATPGYAVAEHMDVTESTVSDYVRTAEQKLDAARETLDALEEIRFPELPSECAECGSALGGRWSENDDEEAVCLDCSGVTIND